MCFYKEVIFSFPRNLSVALVLEHLKQICRDLFKKKAKETIHYVLPHQLHTCSYTLKKKILWGSRPADFLKIPQNAWEKICV